MAKVAAELVTEEELEAKRSSRARTLAKWKKEEPLQKYTLMVGEAFTTAAEAMEDMLRGLEKITIKEGELAGVEVLRGAMRKAHLEVTSTYTRTEIGNRLGLQALDKIFDSTESVEGLMEEEKKLMQAHMKEQQEGRRRLEAWSRKQPQRRAIAITQDFRAGTTISSRCHPTYSSSTVPCGRQEHQPRREEDSTSSRLRGATRTCGRRRRRSSRATTADNSGTGSTSRCDRITANTWRRCSKRRWPTEAGRAERQQQAEEQ
jgi:hypothetical protein